MTMKNCEHCRDAANGALRRIAEITGRDDVLLIEQPGLVREIADIAIHYREFCTLPRGLQFCWILVHCERSHGEKVCPNRYRHQSEGGCQAPDGQFIPKNQRGGCFVEG